MMTILTSDTEQDTKPAKTNRDARLSSGGKWRSSPKVPNLLQYVETGNYFGRVNIEGKIFRSSLAIQWATIVAPVGKAGVCLAGMSSQLYRNFTSKGPPAFVST
jgi:hypothetical protein